MSSQPNTYLSPEEYLAIERKAEYRSEYFAGEMFAMAGASKKRHNLITGNVSRVLGNQLLERECNVYSVDMRVKISGTIKYTYPDIVATCGDEQFEDAESDTLLNPQLIIEVLSPSTEGYDRGKKFEAYQRIASLVEFILVSQEPYRVEHFMRESERRWAYSEYRTAEDTVQLKSIGCELTLKDIYIKVA
jgi:Uma2 family endonuclease